MYPSTYNSRRIISSNHVGSIKTWSHMNRWHSVGPFVKKIILAVDIDINYARQDIHRGVSTPPSYFVDWTSSSTPTQYTSVIQVGGLLKRISLYWLRKCGVWPHHHLVRWCSHSYHPKSIATIHLTDSSDLHTLWRWRGWPQWDQSVHTRCPIVRVICSCASFLYPLQCLPMIHHPQSFRSAGSPPLKFSVTRIASHY